MFWLNPSDIAPVLHMINAVMWFTTLSPHIYGFIALNFKALILCYFIDLLILAFVFLLWSGIMVFVFSFLHLSSTTISWAHSYLLWNFAFADNSESDDQQSHSSLPAIGISHPGIPTPNIQYAAPPQVGTGHAVVTSSTLNSCKFLL